MYVKSIDINQNNLQKGMTRTADHDAASFGTILKESVVEQKNQACSSLLEQIDTQSRELKKTLTPEGLKRYAKLVKAFMKEALGQAYQVGEETSWDRSGNRKNYVIVKKINEKLEEMMQSFIEKEKPQLDLMAKIGEIRGLLLDLFF